MKKKLLAGLLAGTLVFSSSALFASEVYGDEAGDVVIGAFGTLPPSIDADGGSVNPPPPPREPDRGGGGPGDTVHSL